MFDVESNVHLTGDVLSLSNQTSLENLNLRNNSFTGELFSVVATLPSIQVVVADFNKVSKREQEIVNFNSTNLHIGKFSGSIPEEIAECSELTVINANYNNINGSLPESGLSKTTIFLQSLMSERLGISKSLQFATTVIL